MTRPLDETQLATRPPVSHPARSTPQWLAPAGLMLLALIPVLAGALRLGELAGAPGVTAANARFVQSPIPVVIHIVSATVFTLLGALQFVPALRRRRNGWHRGAGRLLLPAGALAALSGMWMAAFYPHPAGEGLAMSVLRLVFGAAMLAALALGARAIAERDFAAHGAWMTRAYAIGIGAGTQALVLIPGAIAFGPTHELSRTVLMGAAWVINLAVAERVIRRRGRRLV